MSGAPMDSSYPVQGVIELACRHPLATKWLVVPKQQGGPALDIAAARVGTGLFDLDALTPLLLSERLGRAALERSGRRRLPAGLDRFMVEEILREGSVALLPLDPRRTHEDNPAIGDALARSIRTLRLAGTDPAEAFAQARSALARALAAAARRYEELLDERRLFDEADLYREAAAARPPRPLVVAVLDEVQLEALPARMLAALESRVDAFYRVGLPTEEATGLVAPPATAAHYFETASRLPAEPRVNAAGRLYAAESPQDTTLRLRTASTPDEEVRAIFREVRDRNLPLDDVEIAYVSPEPYQTIFATYRETRSGEKTSGGLSLPVTIASGRPLASTGPGAFLYGILDWIAEDLPSDGVLRLVRGGLLRLDRGSELEPDVVLQKLSSVFLGGGMEGHRRSVERARLPGSLRTPLLELFSLIPEETTSIRGLATACGRMLAQYGPVDVKHLRFRQVAGAPDDEPFTDDEFVHLQLDRRLAAFASAPSGAVLPLRRAAALLRDALKRDFARAEAPRPGHLHVVPLENAGFSGRSHLYVVGLDSAALASRPRSGPFIPTEDQDDPEDKADRVALGGAALPTGHPADLEVWLAVRALARASGRVTLSRALVDPVSDEPLEPSPLFLRASHRAGIDDVPPFERPSRWGDEHPVDGLAFSLALGCAAAGMSSPESTLETLAGPFPGAARGVLAASLKADPARLTAYDGWIGDPNSIHRQALRDLDLFAGRQASATALQTLAKCPHKYFLQYVLKLRTPDMPPDPDLWLDARKTGCVLHDVFHRFIEAFPPGHPPAERDEATLRRVFGEVIDELEAEFPPPDEAVGRAVRNRLFETARIFYRVTVAETAYEPVALEIGFGLHSKPSRPHAEGYPEDHTEPFELDLPGIAPIPIEGRVDRVDRILEGKHAGRYAVWDYKTGKADHHLDLEDPLDAGRLLQPHLYAYALKRIFGWDVAQTGFLFPSPTESGHREEHPLVAEERLAEVIANLACFPPNGFFVQASSRKNCLYCDYRNSCGDPAERAPVVKAAVRAVQENPEHPAASAIQKWNYLDG